LFWLLSYLHGTHGLAGIPGRATVIRVVCPSCWTTGPQWEGGGVLPLCGELSDVLLPVLVVLVGLLPLLVPVVLVPLLVLVRL
jgi:hypothetical protein